MKSTGLAILGLSALAIAHPLLLSLGQGATFFVAHGASTADILLFTLLIYLGPTAAILAAALCLRVISSKLAKLFLGATVGLLAGLWSLSMTTSWPVSVATGLAVAVVALTFWGYLNRQGLRDFLQILGICSPIVVIYFLAFTPIKTLLVPEASLSGVASGGRDTPIIVLLLDELSLAAITTPDGEIDAGRLPNFSRLEGMSTWYHNTTTVSVQTEKAVPPILSGMRSDANTQPTYSEFPRNLFSLFASSHSVNAIETYTRLCPKSVCAKKDNAAKAELNTVAMYHDGWIVWLHAILPTDLATKHLPAITDKWHNFGRSDDSDADNGQAMFARMLDMERNQKRRFGRFIAHILDSEGPTINYLHLALPHVPWIYLPDGTLYNGRYIPGEAKSFYGWIDDQYLVDKGILRYSLQLEYADRLLGEMLDALEQSDRFDETLLVVVSDHGVAFDPDEKRRIPTASTLASVSRVPLFIKYPGQSEAVRDDRKIETIDILPTITDALGLPLGASFDGQSLLSDNWQAAPRHVLEAGDTIADFEQAMDLAADSEKIYRVLTPGESALDAIGLRIGAPYMGKTVPTSAAAAEQMSIAVHNSRLLSNVDIDSGFLPARLSATATGITPETGILIALNDTFAGGGRIFDDAGSLSVMLDPRLFQEGSNHLRAYVIDNEALIEVTVNLDTESWKIKRSENGDLRIADSSGVTYQVDDTLTGHFKITFEPGAPGAGSGYACDEQQSQAPLALLLVDKETVITDGFQQIEQPPLAKSENAPRELECWFRLEVGSDLRKRHSSLSVVALFNGGRALEIKPDK